MNECLGCVHVNEVDFPRAGPPAGFASTCCDTCYIAEARYTHTPAAKAKLLDAVKLLRLNHNLLAGAPACSVLVLLGSP
jgi:hypothetical protein